MHTTSSKSIDFHFETLPSETQKAFNFLSAQEWLKNSWYLAGGTALALHVGNRKSYDLDFFCPVFFPKAEPTFYGSIKVLAPIDIAVMKIVAISQRGKKRDFFDLYWCANNIESLENIIKRLPEQYPSIVHDFFHISKSLTYFVDAEEDSEPEIYFDTDWKKVKDFFKKEVPEILKRLIKL